MFSLKKISFYLFFFIVAYNLIILIFQSHQSFPQNSAYHANLEIAESYFYKNESVDNLFLGSSITQSIGYKNIKNSDCIAFSGTSALEGLKLLNYDRSKPKRVFIETNLLYSRDQNIADNVVFLADIKRIVLGLQQENKPLKIFMWGLLSLKDNIKSYIDRESYKPATITKQKILKKEKAKQKYIIRHSVNNVDSIYIRSNLNSFKKEVRLLLRDKIEIYLLEIPTHKKVLSSKRHKFLMTEVDEIANELDVIHLRFNDEVFDWTDGIHMTQKSAEAFQEALMKRIGKKELID